MSVREVAERLALGEQTVRDYRKQFRWKGVASLVDKLPPGRPSQLTKTPRKPLAQWLKARPQASGDPSGCWQTPRMQDLLQRRCGVAYQPHYICPLWKHLGFSEQKARCGSAPLNQAKRLAWRQRRWPHMLRQARQRKALWLFGDEARVAQWGSRSSPWAPQGQQPEVPTSGKRQAYKVFGLSDYVSGPFFSTAQTGRGNADSDAACVLDVWSHTKQQVVGIQEGARYHTSTALQEFFAAPAERWTVEPWPAYSPDCNPIEPLGK